MSGGESLGYWSRETRHYSTHHRNEDEISDENIIEVSSGDGRCVYRYLGTSHYYSLNREVHHSSDNSSVDLGHNIIATLPLSIVKYIFCC